MTSGRLSALRQRRRDEGEREKELVRGTGWEEEAKNEQSRHKKGGFGET